jgi:hypothetical protein
MQAIDMMTLQKKTRVLQGLWERSQQISKQIADVEYILLNPQQFAQVNEAVLRTGKAQLEHQLEEVNDQAIKFARNAIDFFDLLDFPLIPLALPSNRYEKPIMMRGEAVGALGGEAVGALGSIIGSPYFYDILHLCAIKSSKV